MIGIADFYFGMQLVWTHFPFSSDGCINRNWCSCIPGECASTATLSHVQYPTFKPIAFDTTVEVTFSVSIERKIFFCLSINCAHSSLPSLTIALLVKLVIYSSMCNEIICTIVQVNGDEAQKSFVTE